MDMCSNPHFICSLNLFKRNNLIKYDIGNCKTSTFGPYLVQAKKKNSTMSSRLASKIRAAPLHVCHMQ